MKKNRVIYFTKYSIKGPSSRYRSFQYYNSLSSEFEIVFKPLFNDSYIYDLYLNHKTNYWNVLFAYFNRIVSVLRCLWTKDILFIEYELLPYFPPVLEKLLKLSNVRFILDFDDAIFHNYDCSSNKLIQFLFRNKIPKIATYSEAIITGSPYLTSFFEKYNNLVIEIPTSIIFEKYYNNQLKGTNIFASSDSEVTVGWIGSKSTSVNLIFIKEFIQICAIRFPNITFKIMGFDSSKFKFLNFKNVIFYKWDENDEFNFLNSIDIGIMPLMDSPWNMGKCGFKLIQYMAMGKPTISSPFEAHLKINHSNDNLFANSISEWVDSLELFLNNMDFYKQVGKKNVEIVKEFYSVESNSYLYTNLFNRIFSYVRH